MVIGRRFSKYNIQADMNQTNEPHKVKAAIYSPVSAFA